MAIFRSLAKLLANGGEYRSMSTEMYGFIGQEGIGIIPFPVIIWILIAIIAHILLNKTRYGRHVIAIGNNEQTSLYSGINVNKVKTITYTLLGLCVGVSALLVSSRMNSLSSSSTGTMYELDAIAAVVIGGTSLKGGSGTIWGTIVGVIILGIINNMLNLLNISEYLQGIIKGVIILIAVFMQQKES